MVKFKLFFKEGEFLQRFSPFYLLMSLTFVTIVTYLNLIGMNFNKFIEALNEKEIGDLKIALSFKANLGDFMELYRGDMTVRLWNVLFRIDDQSMDPFTIDDHFLIVRRNVGRHTINEFQSFINDYRKKILNDASNKN